MSWERARRYRGLHILRSTNMSRSVEGNSNADSPLTVTLAVQTPSGCPLADRDSRAVRQSITRSERDGRDTCQIVTDETGAYRRVPLGDTCPCSIFDDHDCIADLEASIDGRLRYSVVVPDRETVRCVIKDLRASGLTVSLERIGVGAGPDERPGECVSLTEKQQEALAIADAAGYYDRPREATLDDLADELDVTPSAVSQRLTAIERKLVRERVRSVGEP